MTCTRSIVIMAMFLSFSVSSANAGKMARIKLALGRKLCGQYLPDVEKALKTVHGVKTVDLRSMEGHAVVEVEADKVRPEQLVEAIKRVKGDGWHCVAELTRETGKLYRL